MSSALSDVDQQLIDAIKADDFALVEIALASGANVNARAVLGRTPLYYAATAAACPIVELLLQRGADPNLADEDGMSPLHEAVITKKFDCAAALLQGGADINFQDGKRVAPLHSAFFRDLRDRETERMQFILLKGADLSVTMNRGGKEMTVSEVAQDTAEKFPHARVLLAVINTYMDLRKILQEYEEHRKLQAIAETSEKNIRQIKQSARTNKNRFKL